MNKGFTLLELLLVIAIISILSYLAVPIGMNFYRSQTVEGARAELMEALNRARHNAVLMKGDSRYGVVINSIDDTLDSFILYKGNSFEGVGYNSTYDEVYTQSPGLTIVATGSTSLKNGDINFSKLTGLTTATGTLTIIHEGGERRAILIDDFGNAYKI